MTAEILLDAMRSTDILQLGLLLSFIPRTSDFKIIIWKKNIYVAKNVPF